MTGTEIDWGLLWSQAQKIMAALAAAGIVIDMTPGIKFQPVRTLLAWLGQQLNRDMNKKLDDLTKEFESHKVDSWRAEILEFANSCMNRRKHTKEEFDHIIATHDAYAKYVTEKKIENGQVKLAYEYIETLYRQCCEKNSFLMVRPQGYDDDTEREG